MHSAVAAGLLIGAAAWAGPGNQPSGDWDALRNKNLSCGFAAEQVDKTLSTCRKRGLSVSEADALLCPVYAAEAEELPAACVFLKIEEGLAKGVPADQVRATAEQRLDYLRRADELVQAVRQRRVAQHEHLVTHTCMALESGLPETVLQNVFNRPGGFRYGRLIHVIEAGEALQLAGLAPGHIQHIMIDCLDRNLNGAEARRVVEIFQTGLKAGKPFDVLHDSLWVSPGIPCPEY
jgi:hypothetical protein